MIKSSCSISKIFIVFLALFLFSLSVSAELIPGSTQQYGFGSLDFESDSVGSIAYKEAKSYEFSTYRFLDSQGKHTSVTVAAQADGNKYLQFKDLGVPKNNKYTYNPSWQINTNKEPVYDSGYLIEKFSTDEYDFLVLDFELAADAYVYTYTSESSGDDTTTKFDSLPDDANILVKKPAYPEGLILANCISGLESKGAETEVRFFNNIKLVSEGADWHLYAEQNGAYVDTGAKLKSEILEWNHFTVVVEIDRSAGNLANSKQHTYLNGDLVATQPMTYGAQSFADFSNMGYKFEYSYNVANDSRYLYSFGVDNFNINYYMRGSDGSAYSSAGYGLDDFFKDGNPDKGIYNCEDIVYDNSYVEKAPVANVDGTDYYSMKAALLAVEENSTLKLLRSLDNYVPTVNSMTVVVDDSLKFSLSLDAVGYSFEKASQNGVDTYVITRTESGEGSEDDADRLLKDIVFDGAKYNLTTTTSFVGNFYVKVPFSGLNYEIYIGEGSGYAGTVDIEGVPHYKFTAQPLINGITSQITFNITVTVDGEDKTLPAEYTIDEYFAEAMLQLSSIAEPTDYEAAQMRLIMNATRYANELYKYVKESAVGYSEYEEILTNEKYRGYLTSYDEFEIGENEKSDFSEISSVVVNAGLAVHSGYNVSYVLYVKDGLVSAEDLDVTYKSITGAILENEIYPTIMEQVIGEVKYYFFICRDIPIYEMLSPQIISIIGKNGEALTGQYSLGAYIKLHNSSAEGDLAKAMYAYAKSSYQFKVSAED